mmetsp:Transcript_110218/g.308132  ORF Transcript_110218/g.308132 Transcript_110218/m.308132 type:complete len:207 (-) Transcript_110218:55-675(-)
MVCKTLAEIRTQATVCELLDGFFATAVADDCSAPASWGEKVGFSVYDVDEILGRYMTMDELLDDLLLGSLDGFDSEDDDLEEEGLDDSIQEVEARGLNEATAPPSCDLPRLARAIEPLCRAWQLSRDLADVCSVCLASLAKGERAWRLPCLHVFHSDCAARALASGRGRAACPICRSDVKLAAQRCLGQQAGQEQQGPCCRQVGEM